MKFSVVFFLCVLVLNEAKAQDYQNFKVDGKSDDWYGFDFDGINDVVPDTNSTIDIRRFGHGKGAFGPRGAKRELFTFIFKFPVYPFPSPYHIKVEWFFDTKEGGELMPPWEDFRPDYRVGTVMRHGGYSSRQFFRVYENDRWVTKSSDVDIGEIEAVTSEQYLEAAIPWTVLGFPSGTLRYSNTEDIDFQWAFQISNTVYRDFIPDKPYSGHWFPFRDHTTLVEDMSWGVLKGNYITLVK